MARKNTNKFESFGRYASNTIGNFGLNLPFDALRDLGVNVPITMMSPTGYVDLDKSKSLAENVNDLAKNVAIAGLTDIGFTANGKLLKKGAEKALPKLKNIIKPKFKSKLDWASYNPELAKNTERMKEYAAIEENFKKSGQWMKNKDGTPFKGDPREFIQMQSKNFRNWVKYMNEIGAEVPLVNGTPEIFEHYTDNVFERFSANDWGANAYGRGAYFWRGKPDVSINGILNRPISRTEERQRIRSASKKPLRVVMGGKSKTINGVDDAARAEAAANFGRSATAYDGAEILFVDNPTHPHLRMAVKRPVNPSAGPLEDLPVHNIKKVFGNNGDFNPFNQDISKVLLPAVGAYGISEYEDGGRVRFSGDPITNPDKSVRISGDNEMYTPNGEFRMFNPETTFDPDHDYQGPTRREYSISRRNDSAVEYEFAGKNHKTSYYKDFNQRLSAMAQQDPEISAYSGFLTVIADMESAFNPSAKNPNSPAYGYFQFMEDGKNYKNITTYAGTDINTFLENPEIQIQAAVRLAKDFEKNFTDDDYRMAREQGYSDDAMLAGAWLGGVGAVRRFLKSGEDSSDRHWSSAGTGSSVGAYMKKINDAGRKVQQDRIIQHRQQPNQQPTGVSRPSGEFKLPRYADGGTINAAERGKAYVKDWHDMRKDVESKYNKQKQIDESNQRLEKAETNINAFLEYDDDTVLRLLNEIAHNPTPEQTHQIPTDKYGMTVGYEDGGKVTPAGNQWQSKYEKRRNANGKISQALEKAGKFLTDLGGYATETAGNLGLNLLFDAARAVGVNVPVTTFTPTGSTGADYNKMTPTKKYTRLVGKAVEGAITAALPYGAAKRVVRPSELVKYAATAGAGIAGGEFVDLASNVLTGKSYGQNLANITGIDESLANIANPGYAIGGQKMHKNRLRVEKGVGEFLNSDVAGRFPKTAKYVDKYYLDPSYKDIINDAVRREASFYNTQLELPATVRKNTKKGQPSREYDYIKAKTELGIDIPEAIYEYDRGKNRAAVASGEIEGLPNGQQKLYLNYKVNPVAAGMSKYASLIHEFGHLTDFIREYDNTGSLDGALNRDPYAHDFLKAGKIEKVARANSGDYFTDKSEIKSHLMEMKSQMVEAGILKSMNDKVTLDRYNTFMKSGKMKHLNSFFENVSSRDALIEGLNLVDEF